MSKFLDAGTALGFFWPAEQTECEWAGRLLIDGFPRAELSCLGDLPAETKFPIDWETVHGITRDGEFISMFEVDASHGYWHQSGSDGFNINIISNYMTVGSCHLVDEHQVKRISFSSSAISNAYNLFPNPFRPEIRYRGARPLPIYDKLVFSCYDHVSGVRVRFVKLIAYRRDRNDARMIMSFDSPLTIREAMRWVIDFRALFTTICNSTVDVRDITILIFDSLNKNHTSELYFNYSDSNKNDEYAHTTVPNFKDLKLVVKNWLSEDGLNRTSRRIFKALIEDNVIKMAHVSEFVTLLEMQSTTGRNSPFPKKTFRKLRTALEQTVEQFADKERKYADGAAIIKNRLQNPNSHFNKMRLNKLISKIPKDILNLPDNFISNLVDLRNSISHDVMP